jgi:hypothetical protein
MTVHLPKDVGNEPDNLFDERSKTFKVVELITAIEPARKQRYENKLTHY